jgi:hypothetical protein
MAGCYVFVTSRRYRPEHDAVLLEVLLSEPELCVFVGVDCAAWLRGMDWLAVVQYLTGEKAGSRGTATAHVGESLEDVTAFVQEWCDRTGLPPAYRIVQL